MVPHNQILGRHWKVMLRRGRRDQRSEESQESQKNPQKQLDWLAVTQRVNQQPGKLHGADLGHLHIWACCVAWSICRIPGNGIRAVTGALTGSWKLTHAELSCPDWIQVRSLVLQHLVSPCFTDAQGRLAPSERIKMRCVLGGYRVQKNVVSGRRGVWSQDAKQTRKRMNIYIIWFLPIKMCYSWRCAHSRAWKYIKCN